MPLIAKITFDYEIDEGDKGREDVEEGDDEGSRENFTPDSNIGEDAGEAVASSAENDTGLDKLIKKG